MSNVLSKIISKKEIQEFKDFIYTLNRYEREYLLRNDIIAAFIQFCYDANKTNKFVNESSVRQFIDKIPEMFFKAQFVYVKHRYMVAKYKFYRIHIEEEYMDEISVSEFLDVKESSAIGQPVASLEDKLRIDLMPFYDYSPSIKDTKQIGKGMAFLNQYMASSLFQEPEKWEQKIFEFIKLCKLDEHDILINNSFFKNVLELKVQLPSIIEWLKTKSASASYEDVKFKLKKNGIEAGWGNTVKKIADRMQLFLDLLNQPSSTLLADFISGIPMISKVAIISPHGWFAQDNVLGKPDTGGQVIYILDQVKALEKFLIKELAETGIDAVPKIIVLTRLIPNAENTTCNQRLEKIYQTNNSWILRVPFKDKNGKILEDWISRFSIWPYLDRFVNDSKIELLGEFQGNPHLLIGNYSDGNLVATLLSEKLDVIQCTIAHALEKSKYLFSDLYWQSMEDEYKFSLQFTADIIAMNKSNFIITSTFQEIAGSEIRMGQYESYQHFTMPNLYQVVNGINLFHPKFNVIPPGVDENNYFPFYEKEKRVPLKSSELRNMLFELESPSIYGKLDDLSKPSIFTMARLDKIKNISGFVETFGYYQKLQEHYNLIVAAGTINIDESLDSEERAEIQKLYDLIEKYNLKGKIRWLPSINKKDTGEIYRIIAEQNGVFVQPALFEAFGLTILESMLSGLPTFGPIFGGSSEIIEDKISGYLMNTTDYKLMGKVLLDFIDECKIDSNRWQKVSDAGIRRVRDAFTWNNYSRKLFSLTKIYGFWRYSVSNKAKIKMSRYCDLLYYLLFKPRAKELENNLEKS